MKRKSIMSKFMSVKRTAVLLAAAMLLPVFAVGCESAQDIIKKRERADEVAKLAETYMQEKYSRGFKVKKCEAAEGEAYEGDFFISFSSGVHAFYDAETDLFYDDRQSEAINEGIMREIWMPLFESLGVLNENLSDSSQTFNMVYCLKRGATETKYSMYHEYFDTTPEYFAVHSKLSVSSDNIILLEDQAGRCKTYYEQISKQIGLYFRGQEKGDLNIYGVSNELHERLDYDPNKIDETTEGCVAHMHFGKTKYCAYNRFIKMTDNLYGSICHLNGITIPSGSLNLIPVEDTEATKKSIIENMDSKEMSLLDKYVSKKRQINVDEAIYKLEITDVNQSFLEEMTVAFRIRESEQPVAEYAEIDESKYGFFVYNMNGSEYNATCLCSPNSRSVMFTYKPGDEVYFWFGSQK